MKNKLLLCVLMGALMLMPGCKKAEKSVEAPEVPAATEDTNRGEDINAFLHGDNKALVDEFEK